MIMPARIDALHQTTNGLLLTDRYVIGYTNDTTWQGSLCAIAHDSGLLFPVQSDDLGLFIVIPWLAKITAKNPTVLAYWFLSILATIAYLIFLYYTYKASSNKFFVLTLLCSIPLFAFTLYRSDLYIFNLVSVCLTPFFFQTNYFTNSIKKIFIISALIGAFSTILGSFRSGANLFFLSSFFIPLVIQFLRAKNHIPFILYILGVFISIWVTKNLIAPIYQQRDEFFLHTPTCESAFHKNHVFWHTLYVGLGYIPNNHGLAFNDQVAFDKVHKLNPLVKIYSSTYENLLRNEVIKLIKTDIGFIFSVYLVKTFVILGLIALFLLPGWLIDKASFSIKSALIIFTLAFITALPGLIAIPKFNYISGLFWIALSYFSIKNMVTSPSFDHVPRY